MVARSATIVALRATMHAVVFKRKDQTASNCTRVVLRIQTVLRMKRMLLKYKGQSKQSLLKSFGF